MDSRYTSINVIDYCFHPLRIFKDGRDIIVPCGKCDGCLLHSANEWSMRCGMEIESSPSTIFGTLTYNNKYIPKLVKSGFYWFSDNKINVRFNGSSDVLRDDHIIINGRYNFIPLSNWNNEKFPIINYASKRDIQLWLKLLRKDLFDYGFYSSKNNIKKGLFRYFVISEVGPTTYRSHFHFLLFCSSVEISSYLLDGVLYKNWKMCDENRFTPYCHICDSGARGYVTQYLTSSTILPDVYRENKEIKPFRLSSKSPAIGYSQFDKKKVFEDIERGIIKYTRKIVRLESDRLLVYPKNFVSTLFPKCFEFDKMDIERRCSFYGTLYRLVRKCGFSYNLLLSRFSKVVHSSDLLAWSQCYRFCLNYVDSPDYYYYLLDMYYYSLDMENLRNFYCFQESLDFNNEPWRIFELYPNLEIYFMGVNPSSRDFSFLSFLYSFGFDVMSLFGNKIFFEDIRKIINSSKINYINEVSDIVNSMVKSSKFNEFVGVAPTL